MDIDSKIREWSNNASEQASKDSQISTIAQFIIQVMRACSKRNDPRIEAAIEQLETAFLPSLALEKHPGTMKSPIYNLDELTSFAKAASGAVQSAEELGDFVILAFIKNEIPGDQTAAYVRHHCDFAGLTKSVFTSKAPSIGELGFGTWFSENEKSYIERPDEEQIHFPLLHNAITRNNVFLMTGAPGVGKSCFLSQLLSKAVRIGIVAKRIAIFETSIFTFSPKATATAAVKLANFLIDNPTVVPVFDDFDRVAIRPESLRAFETYLAPLFQYNDRSAVFACRSDVVPKVTAFADIERRRLAAMDASKTKSVLEAQMPQLLRELNANPEPENGLEKFTRFVVDATSDRYGESQFPRSALRVLNGACGQGRAKDKSNWQIARQHVHEYMSVDLGINPELLGGNHHEFHQKKLYPALKDRIFGQDHVVTAIVKRLYEKSVAPSKEKPRGRFLFVGAPGTGKTQLCKVLAEELGYGSGAFYQFNMGEFAGEDAKNRFIGSNPGYKQSMETFTVFNAVKDTPACVILLDEVDRAHSSIQDILLGFLEGRGRDAEGRSHRFDQAIFVMTTNQGQEVVENAYRDAVTNQVSFPEGKKPSECEEQQKKIRQLREQFTKGLEDGTKLDLRSMLLKRAITVNQSRVIDFIKHRMHQISLGFPDVSNSLDDKKFEILSKLSSEYAQLAESQRGIQYNSGKTMLDRALLDRIDFIFPFLPLEFDDLMQICDIQVREESWEECPNETRTEIVDLAYHESERGRAVGRYVGLFKQKSAKFSIDLP